MRFEKRWAAETLAVAVMYFVLARLGLRFATLNDSASPVWPASGFAIGTLIAFGPRLAFGVFLGATFANLMQQGPWWCAATIGFGNACEAVLGALLYSKIKKSETKYGPLVEAFAVIAAAGCGALSSPSVGVTALAAAGEIPWSAYKHAWITWWSGDAIGALFVVPLVMAARFHWEQEHGKIWRAFRLVTALQLLLGAGAATALIMLGDGTWFLCGAMLLLLAMTAGNRPVDPALASVVIASIGIGGIRFGFGPFRAGTINDNLLNLQLFMSSIAISVLFLRTFMKLGPVRVPGLVLAGGCLLGGLITFNFVRRAEASDQQRIDRIVAENSLRVEERSDAYQQAVDGAGAFFGADPARLDHDDATWSRYVQGIDLAERFPGMGGLGVAELRDDGRQLVRLFAPARLAAPNPGDVLDLNGGHLFVKRLAGSVPEVMMFAPVSIDRFFGSIPYFSAEEMAFELRPAGGTELLFAMPRTSEGRPWRDTPIEFAGRRYDMRWYRLPAFASSHDTTVAWVTTAISLIALALAAFVANLQAVRLRAEELARSMAKMSTLGEMAGGIAHEINNPLTVIGVTIAQLARDVETGQFDKEAMAKKVERIDRTVKRITSIVQGLRVFSRSSDSVQKQAVKIQDVVNNVTDLCHDRFRHNGVALDVSGSLEVEVHASIVQIEQVLLNLLSNAFDAVQTAATKWVSLTVEATDREVRLVVQDSGGPIPEAVAQKMMEPFYTTKELGKGTGLGLSISKGILASHGGQLLYDGNRKHTCFVMILPRPVAQGRVA